MKTSYYANTHFRNFNKDFKGGVSIALTTPEWYNGQVYEKLYPTEYLVSIKSDMATYEPLYKEQILGRLDVHEVWKEINELTGDLEPILLCFEKDINACHRGIVAKWFKDAGYEIEEMPIVNKGDKKK